MSNRIKGIIDAVSDLAMDYSSRMARANDIDFDTRAPKYHGTNNLEGFDQFDPLLTGKGSDQYGPGFYLSTSPQQASGYADGLFKGRGLPVSDSPGVLPLYTRSNNLMEVDGKSANHLGEVLDLREDQVRGMLDQSSALKRSVDHDDMNPLGDYYESFWSGGADDWMLDDLASQYAGRNPEELTDLFADNGEFLGALSDATGFDGLNVKFGNDLANEVHWRPENIRSTSAQFDPSKKDSSNLLASATGLGLLGGSMFASEDADAGILSRIKAFHGSPHDFDRFSSDNIGTGEGAQAYGHGLYFAEREGTATTYKKSTNYSDKKRQFQRELPDDADAADVMDMSRSGAFSPEMTELVDALNDDDWLGFDHPSQAISAALSKNITDYDPSPRLIKATNSGHMYEVDINASTDDLLDYDLPLKDQPEKIQNAFKDIWRDRLTDDPILKEIYKTADDVDFNTMGLFDQSQGSQAYREFANKLGGEASLSKLLNDKGVKGIKYADAQTRFSPKGRTNNFVVFDDKTIEIAKKYGVTMPVAGAILAGTITPEQAQASTKPEGNGLLDSIGDTALETMSGVNRAVADGVNFLTSDQINAVLNLSGSEKRIPDLYDIPGVKSGTKGNYMEPGLLRQIVRQGSEFLSPI